MNGKIKNIGPAYGFIISEEGGQEYYFRTLNIENDSKGKIFRDDAVFFEAVHSETGRRPEAVKIRLAETAGSQSNIAGTDFSTVTKVTGEEEKGQSLHTEDGVDYERTVSANPSTLRGMVDYFENGEGFINANDGHKYGVSFVNIIAQKGYKTLYPTEEVVFEPHPTSKFKIALNVRLVTRPLTRGTIISFNEEDGVIEADGTHEHYKFLAIYISHKQYWEYETGDRVKFRPVRIQGHNCAVRVSWIDKIKPLERFADLSKFEQLLSRLAGMTDEDWDFRVRPTGGLPILENYLLYTFKRIEQQEKILTVKHSKSGKWMASFNTGLATPQQQEIFAFFKEVDGYDPEKHMDPDLAPPRWRMEAFVTESDTAMLDFHPLPKLATYFEWSDLGSLIYDHNFELRIRREHILKDRKDRLLDIRGLPDYIKENEEALVSQFNVAVELAKKRVMRNYKTAIPTFSRGELSLLLPLCMVKKDGADLALLVQRKNNYYMAWTILPLDIAYMNARLIARPDTEWLNP